MNQTTVQYSDKISFGSGKFEILEAGSSTWINLGAMRDIIWAETFDKVTVMSDNAGIIKEFIKNHRATLGGNLMEIDLLNLSIIRGGIDTYATRAGQDETLKSGGLTTIAAIQARVTNTDEEGEIFKITLYKATNNKGIEIAFQPDDADDPNMIAIEVQGSLDTSRTAGDQLFEMYSGMGEQGTASATGSPSTSVSSSTSASPSASVSAS